MIKLFQDVSHECSRYTTKCYSSSFISAIKMLHKDLRTPVYNIYGFVRFADEIVDTFHGHDKAQLLQEFKQDTWLAIERKISLNPILNSFQDTVHKFHIDQYLIEAFFCSMEIDIEATSHDEQSYKQYIFGSAEAVGLMCLFVFCNGDKRSYEMLKPSAQALGAAFQKVNFLRDLKADYEHLNRIYFPGVDFRMFTAEAKKQIEQDIAIDFEAAYKGILNLPVKARFGVYVAYKYYLSLFKKIKKTQPEVILENRIRIHSYSKFFILIRAGLKSQLNLI